MPDDGTGYRPRRAPDDPGRSGPTSSPAWFEAFGTAFYIWPGDPHAQAELAGDSIDLERTFGAFEGDQIVGTFRSFPSELTLPGGARSRSTRCPRSSVRPTHRRRGTLSRMIARRFRSCGGARRRGLHPDRRRSGRSTGASAMGRRPGTPKWTLRTRAAPLRASSPSGRSRSSIRSRRAGSCRTSTTRIAAGQPGEIDRPDHRVGLRRSGSFEMPGPAAVARLDRDPSRRRRRPGRLRPVPRRGGLGRTGSRTTCCCSTSCTG